MLETASWAGVVPSLRTVDGAYMKPYYQDDLVTLYHGDCREVTVWTDADVLVTDPPYGINYKSSRFGSDNRPVIIGEDYTGRAAGRVLTDHHVRVRDAALTLWGDRPGLVFGSWRAPRPARTIHRLVWDKSPVGQGGVGPWRVAEEEVYVIGPPEAWGRKDSGQPHTNVIRGYKNGVDRPDHPTPKPVGLMVHLIEACPAGVIADPFAGSGSTLRAAKDLGRQCVGVEIDERYCEDIARRLSQDSFDFGEAAS